MSRPRLLRTARGSALGQRTEHTLRQGLHAFRHYADDAAVAATADPPQRYDGWFEHLAGDRLAALDAECAGALAAGPQAARAAYARFADLDVDLWAMLLTQDYDVYPNVKALLPAVPEPAVQEMWNGASGVRLANQSQTFYAKVLERYATYAERPIDKARVLDHGIGWGRLARFFARDVAPGHLFGTDPVQAILDVCRRDRVPAEVHKSAFLPDELPVGDLNLAYAFSVFTHLSETAAERNLAALHGALRPGGLLLVTIRPPDYVRMSPMLAPLARRLPAGWPGEPRHVFVAHPAQDSHFQYEGGEMTYGEAIVTLPYVRERWAPRFELLDVAPLVGDLHQVMLTLRRA